MSTTLPDVDPAHDRRTLKVTQPYYSPDSAIVAAVYRERDSDDEVSYPVQVDRKALLDALGAEPDETDYQEVLAENYSLGRKIATAIRDRDAAERERDSALEALRDASEATEEPREDQAQIDRSWALEKAGEVLGRLAAVGIDAKTCGVSLLPLAEWILGGESVDRG